MDETLTNQLRREWHRAQRDRRPVTHWLMTNERRDRLRYEHKDQIACATDQPESFMGCPIYFTDDHETLGARGFMLREGEPPDYLRERELRQQLAKIHRAYQDKIRPIVDELARLEARKPPQPQFFPSALGGIVAPR